MPRISKRAGRKSTWRKPTPDAHADITLDDFANSKTNGGRLKKASSNALVREVKDLRALAASDDRDWFEKDLDEFDIDAEDNSDEQIHEPSAIPKKNEKSGNPRRCRKDNRHGIETDSGTHYPLDIWHLISEYIQPEFVATFACICKSALAVVNTTRFWLKLYKRYYKSSITLPERLQPECMERVRGLKACVIRSLYYTYPPFAERVRSVPAFDDRQHGLVRSRCILMWHQKVKNLWHFYFKFQRSWHGLKPSSDERLKRCRDLLQMLDDVHANSEDGYQVLQVSCHTFIPTPVVIGLFLSNVTFNVSQEMHHYRLRLMFATSHYGSCFTGTVVQLEPVASVRVFNWWHPQYPHAIR